MGLFDFLKKNHEIEKERESALMFENLKSWLADEAKKNSSREHEDISKLDSALDNLTRELRKEKKEIGQISLKDRNIYERVEAIVSSSLANYLVYLDELMSRLEHLDKKHLVEMIGSINFRLVEFKQKSALNFGRASYISDLDRELRRVHESINNFLKEFNHIVESEKDFIEKLKLLDFAGHKLVELEKAEKIRSEIAKGIAEIELKIEKSKKKLDYTEKKAEEIIKSSEYLKMRAEKSEAIVNKAELEKEIIKLRAMIDLKSLAKKFHENEKAMSIIKSYETDFSRIFEEDKELISLLDESQKEGAKQKINEITRKRHEIMRIFERKDMTEEIRAEIDEIKEDIKNVESDLEKENSRLEKSEQSLKIPKNEIKNALGKLDVKIE
jgi:chromosome segregation ATPase